LPSIARADPTLPGDGPGASPLAPPGRPRYLKDRIRRSLSLDHTQERSIASLIYRRGRSRAYSRPHPAHEEDDVALREEASTLKIRVPAHKSPKNKRSLGGHALSLGKLIIGPFRRKSKTSLEAVGGTGGTGAHDLLFEDKQEEPIARRALGPLGAGGGKQVTHAPPMGTDSPGEGHESSDEDGDGDRQHYLPATRKPRRARDRRYRSDEPTKNGRFVPESIQESKLPMETLGGRRPTSPSSSSPSKRKFSDPGLLSPRSSRKRHSLDSEFGPASQRPIRKRSSLRCDAEQRPLFHTCNAKNSTPSSSSSSFPDPDPDSSKKGRSPPSEKS